MNRRGTLFVITGPSGAGKGTVLKRVLEKLDNVYFSVSATTRPPREGEIDGVHYHFMTRERFEQMIEDNELLEHAEYAGNYYGTPAGPVDRMLAVGKDVLLEIEVQGALQVKRKRADAQMVFLAPPSFAELERRLRGRHTESAEAIARRLEAAKRECATIGEFQYIVENDVAEEAAEELCAIIRASRCRVDHTEFRPE
ncbi:MAG: guanylate kinase [Clostridiaceae bacterium]|nr:guanylate kinase [Clostridiaceae bacterium]